MINRGDFENGRRRTWAAVALSAVMAAMLGGCGENYRGKLGSSYPVKGKVTLPDGKPLPQVKVIFSGPVTNGVVTESDGTFAFKGDGAGLAAGDYQVHLEITESKGSLRRQTLPFPKRYLDEDASGLTASVKPDGPNDFEFKLSKEEADQGSLKAGKGKR
jgi:hypothetical protein